MRLKLTSILCLFVLLGLSIIVPAEAFSAISTKMYDFSAGYWDGNINNTIYYKYVRENNKIIGVEACSPYSDSTSGYSGAVSIPSEATDNEKNTYTVIGIRSNFAAENKNITSVKIPSTVTYIGGAAFSESGLTSITIPSDSKLKSIGNYAFDGTNISSITLPKTLQSIGRNTFYKTNITTLTIPEGVTVIPQNMCAGCKNLTTVTLPNSIVTVEANAFNTASITKITMPTGIKFLSNLYDWFAQNVNIYTTSHEPIALTSKIFSDTNYQSAKLNVPYGSQEKYKSSKYWSEFNNVSTYTLTSSDVVECNDLTVKPDEIVSLNINIKSSFNTTYKGFIFDLILPANVSLSSADLSNQLKAIGWGNECIKTYKYSDNVVKIHVIPDYDTELTSTITGNIINLSLKADEHAVENSVVNVSNFIFIDTNSKPIYTKGKESNVTITDIPIFSVNWTEDYGEPSLREGETLQLSAKYLPNETETASYTWQSSDPDVATVSNGLVTALKSGVTKITVSAKNSLNEKSNSIYVIVKEPLWGDANDNGVVNVADVVTIANTIASRKVDKFFKITADINKDNTIDVTDLNGTVNIVLGKSVSPSRAPKFMNQKDDDYLFINSPANLSDGKAIVTVNLENPSRYSSIQADVVIPEGMNVRNVMNGECALEHSLIYNVVDDNILKVVIYSLQNSPFRDGTQELFNIELDTKDLSGTISIKDIIASDSECNKYSIIFSGECDLTTDSVDGRESSSAQINIKKDVVKILNAVGKEVSIYTPNGYLLTNFMPNTDYEIINLDSGLYVLRIGTKSFKINIK